MLLDRRLYFCEPLRAHSSLSLTWLSVICKFLVEFLCATKFSSRLISNFKICSFTTGVDISYVREIVILLLVFLLRLLVFQNIWRNWVVVVESLRIKLRHMSRFWAVIDTEFLYRLLIQVKQHAIRFSWVVGISSFPHSHLFLQHHWFVLTNVFYPFDGLLSLGLPIVNVVLGLLFLEPFQHRYVVVLNLFELLISDVFVETGCLLSIKLFTFTVCTLWGWHKNTNTFLVLVEISVLPWENICHFVE